MTQELNDNEKWLAAEFAMGALDRETMKQAEQRYETDRLFRSAVDEWNNRLSPMLEGVAPIQPDAKVWDQIAGKTSQTSVSSSNNIWQSLNFWRGFSLISGGLATAAIAALLYLFDGIQSGTPTITQPLVATLSATGNAPTLLARFDPETNNLMLRAALPGGDNTKVAELWIIPEGGTPHSLGLLESADMMLSLDAETSTLINDGGTLAISLEPMGGSPTGAPTGPVIASGKLHKF